MPIYCSGGGVVFVGYDEGSVATLHLEDGTLLWTQSVVSPEGRTELERLADVGQQMVIVAGDLIVSSYKNHVVSLAADSGRLLWFKDISSATGIQVDRTNLAISESNGDLWLLDRKKRVDTLETGSAQQPRPDPAGLLRKIHRCWRQGGLPALDRY